MGLPQEHKRGTQQGWWATIMGLHIADVVYYGPVGCSASRGVVLQSLAGENVQCAKDSMHPEEIGLV